MLAVIGDLLEDIVVTTAGPPVRGTDTAATMVRRRGSGAANVAAAAAAAGATVRFLGRVGADAAGRALADQLAEAGVEVRVQRAGRTGAVIVLVDHDGERTMLPDRAAAVELDAIDPGWLDGVSVLHVPVYSLAAEPVGAATALIATTGFAPARPGDRRRLVDEHVDAWGAERLADALAELAPTVVFANADEAGFVPAGGGGWLTVVKQGAAPVLLREPGGRERADPVPSLGPLADTTGAGDAFAAGYLAALLRGADPVAAAGAGIASAHRLLGARQAPQAPPASQVSTARQ